MCIFVNYELLYTCAHAHAMYENPYFCQYREDNKVVPGGKNSKDIPKSILRALKSPFKSLCTYFRRPSSSHHSTHSSTAKSGNEHSESSFISPHGVPIPLPDLGRTASIKEAWRRVRLNDSTLRVRNFNPETDDGFEVNALKRETLNFWEALQEVEEGGLEALREGM